MNKYITSMLFVIAFSATLSAQQSAIYTNELVQYNQALELYNNKQFLAAQNLFDKVRDAVDDENIDANCSYYIANCAVWLNQKDADQLLESFVVQYPTSIKRNSAYLDAATYYFDNGKYAYARKWYDKVNEGNLSRSEKEKFNFNNGYAYFKIQRFNEAKKFLNRVQDSPEYGAKAKYYLGFIAYEGDNYQEADKLFDEVKDLDQYNKNLSYFQSDMNFKSGNFEEAINEGLAQLPKSKPSEKSELNKIIGESYFNLGEYEKAIPHLKEYKGRKGKWNNTDYYYLGYAYYKQGDYTNAISEFNKIVGGRNATAQNAYYHLAESYLKTDQKQQALNAFKNASEMDFEAKIKEDALYNYAKLSYEIGNSYESTPKILLGYLDQYPNSEFIEEIQELLISSYITSKNYREAMDLLEGSRNFADKEVYQKVAFYRGIELYNENNYSEAITYFDKSLDKQVDPRFTVRAIYWKAESNYLLNDFDEALIGFKQFQGSTGASTTVEYQQIEYNLGYTYFKLKQYPQAAQFFEAFSKKNDIDEARLVDTYLRLGDSHFISSKYWPAMEAYNKAIKANGPDADYAFYQKAISYGFVNKNDQKIQDLEMFIKKYPRSTYRDDAMFALGDVYISETKTNRGIAAYDRLIRDVPRSSYVPKALLKQGLVFYNGDQGDRALSKFKKVVSEYPGSEEAIQAVNTARLIYVDLGRTDEYASWVKGLSFVDISDADLDNTSFEAAEKQFLENNDNGAIKGFEKYVTEFPNGLHALKSHFHLAQLYFKKGDKEAAIPHYEFVLKSKRTEFTEQALARLSEIYLENRNYEKAISVLERLESDADYPQNIIFAQSNLMKLYYRLLNYQKTIEYADKVLANPKIQNKVKSDAKIFIARAALQTNDMSRAKKAYAEVQKIAIGELAAEALYYDAYFKNEEGNFKSSNETIQKLAKDYPGYRLYGSKGLVLMAKNFYGLNDAYQATYILESVVKNFSDFPEIVDEANEELKKIKAEEAKTNSSIQTEQ
ncbi:tetratricopeptide repeat protein [Aquimarina celericrescens]|uniref:Tetratricopeptide repeat protein n=1 Tax=Aquimarina celericrescens TaxID=1964542 RepID=A0ABW5AY88_9FLAO|nr:tetratricopeptide repeat protein [Aquimarina celericrescens]